MEATNILVKAPLQGHGREATWGETECYIGLETAHVQIFPVVHEYMWYLNWVIENKAQFDTYLVYGFMP